jgi:hypothetical protein
MKLNVTLTPMIMGTPEEEQLSFSQHIEEKADALTIAEILNQIVVAHPLCVCRWQLVCKHNTVEGIFDPDSDTTSPETLLADLAEGMENHD